MELYELEQHYRNHKHGLGEGLEPIDQRAFITIVIPDTSAATAANYGVFFTATRSCRLISVKERHKTAGTDGSAVTLQIERLTSGTALDAGTELLTSALSLKATADTTQSGTLIQARYLTEGDSLALKDAGTLTNVAHVEVTIEIAYTLNV